MAKEMASQPNTEQQQNSMALIRAPLPLPKVRGAVSLLTYNVLLPNSQDGWWMYKMYAPKSLQNRSQASWEHRSKLLQGSIASADADVVCLQEVSGESFDTDFEFMRNLGYTEHALYRKGRFRPATFWKPKLRLKCMTHGDRCLGTTFSLRDEEHDVDKYFSVVNCHLQAGSEQGARRVRQVTDAMESVFKTARREREEFEKLHAAPQRKSKKNKAKNSPTNQNTTHLDDIPGAPPRPEDFPIVLCGDLNGGDESAAVRLLEDGFIPKAFEEGGIIVNPKKEKAGKFGTFTDISSHCEERSPPPTMVVQELISRLILETNPGPDSGGSSPGSENNTSDGVASPDPDPSTSLAGDEVTGTNEVTLTEEATSSLKRMFDRYSQAKVYMSPEDVGEWLVTINGVVGRGSEFRAAVACMSGGGRSGDGSNTSANLYESNDPGLKIDTVEEGSMSGGVDGEGSAVADLGTPAPAALPSNGRLAWEDFEGIYKDEIKAGKFWGVQHDLNACGCPLQDSPQREGEVFSGRYDRIYIGGGLQPPDILAVRDSVCDRACPNDEQGSDHLPVGVVVRIY